MKEMRQLSPTHIHYILLLRSSSTTSLRRCRRRSRGSSYCKLAAHDYCSTNDVVNLLPGAHDGGDNCTCNGSTY